MNLPRPIGFWRSSNEVELPTPQSLVRPGWLSDSDKQSLISYLEGGDTYETWRGQSWCRFRCDGDLGCRDFTDGVWIWPEGLAHYVEKHDVILPDKFVTHCRISKWVIPDDASSRLARTHDYDFSDWIAWAAR